MSEKEPGTMKKAKGMAKKAVGEVLGNEEMKAEGREEREGAAEGHQAYFQKLLEETNERVSGKA